MILGPVEAVTTDLLVIAVGVEVVGPHGDDHQGNETEDERDPRRDRESDEATHRLLTTRYDAAYDAIRCGVVR